MTAASKLVHARPSEIKESETEMATVICVGARVFLMVSEFSSSGLIFISYPRKRITVSRRMILVVH